MSASHLPTNQSGAVCPLSGEGDQGRRLRPYSGGMGQDRVQGTVHRAQVSRTPAGDGELCRLNSEMKVQNIPVCNSFSEENRV